MSRNVLQPTELPSPDLAVQLFTQWRDKPSAVLHGVRPIDLLSHYDVDRTWFVGSSAWYPAVMGEIAPDDADVDIVFSTEDQALDFFDRASVTLAARRPDVKHSITPNRYGGRKFSFDGQTKNVLDCWSLPPGHSIAEHILTFPQSHEHCAILAGAQPGEVTALTRIVRLPTGVRIASWNYANHEREYNRAIGKAAAWDFGS